MGEFAKLGLKKDILNVLESLKLKESFEVQDQIIPVALKGKNIVFTSKTGSGKTLAYLLGFVVWFVVTYRKQIREWVKKRFL
jgi:superfamily II DNA/RNA helicase